MKLPDLPSLNRPETRSLMRRNQKFPIELTGQHLEAVLGFKYVPEKTENGRKSSAHFLATVKILESDRPEAVGRKYTLAFWLGGEFQQYADAERGRFLAACVKQDPENPEFDFDAAQQLMVDADEAGNLESGECQIIHTRTERKYEVAASVADIKAGKPAVVEKVGCRDYFNAVT